MRTHKCTHMSGPIGLLAGLLCIPSPYIYFDACQAFSNVYPTVLDCACTTPSYKGLCSAAPAIVHLPCIELYGAFSSTGAWPLLLCARASSVFEHTRCILVTLQIRHQAPNGHCPRLQRQAPRERHLSRIRMPSDSRAPSVGYLSYLRRPPRLSALRSVSSFHVQM